jgi:lysine 6-dehydrogenase
VRRILQLGAGRVGEAIARDLAGEFELTVADLAPAALARLRSLPGVHLVQADLRTGPARDELVAAADLVVGAVPGPLGFETLRAVIEAGKPVVDISFFEEDALSLDALARARGVVALVDCGIAPGCSNLILGMHAAELERIDRFWCVVGGLPVERSGAWEYKAPFSPIDVIAEYTRPARLRRGGVEVVLPALSEVELVDLPGVGVLEAFNTDGLRTLLRTLPVPDMVEKTLRYPGHAERVRALRDSGFFAETPVRAGDTLVRPIELSAALLFEAWRYVPGEADLTVMQVVVEGRGPRGRERHRYDLLDRADPQTGLSSMARTTGFTCSAAVRLVASGAYARAGVTPPETLGGVAGCARSIFADLERRGVRFRHEEKALAD